MAIPPYVKVLNYGQHNTPFARNSDIFFDELEQTATGLGLPSFGAGLPPDARENLYVVLKACVDLAVHVSPLTLLRPHQMGISLDRGVLIEVRAASLPKYALIANGSPHSVG